MSYLTRIARLLPYFIVERLLLKYQSDMAIIEFSRGQKYSVNVYETGAGTWIIKSSRAELLESRVKLERRIKQIDNRLEDDEH